MKRYVFLFFVVILILQACNLPASAPPTDIPVAPSAESVATAADIPQTQSETPTVTSEPAATDTPSSTATPQNPLVLRDTLCWVGPGNKYEVVSAVKAQTRIELIGRGTVDGWWVIVNPIYKDACWLQSADVQIEPGFDTSKLKLIDPPATPTPTLIPSPTPV
jgi:hypothetical protein